MQTTNGLVVETSQDRLVLANRHLHLEFTCTPEGGWALSTLRRNGAPDRNWIVSAAGRVTPLWRARFLHEQYLPPDEGARSRWDVRLHENWVEADSLIQSQVEVSAQDDGEAATLRLVWRALPVTETGETADVTVSVTLQADSPLSQWRMEAQSTATSVGLWETHFPILGNLAAREETTLIVPAGWGQAICPAGAEEELYQGHYPSGRCVMQLMCLTDDQETIYFAAADPAAYYKRLLVKGNSAQESVEMSIVQYPETMGDLRNRYASPYAVEIGVLPGDWYTAAKHYRSWALNAPWTVKGPIETRADTPQWIKETVLWANSAALAADAVERIVQETTAFADYFGVPTALHWYSWHEIPFDDHYPDYFPAKP
ncbi:MAG: hypothetical protein IT328_27825, partial [Caldilineaceae bacterium]|nr:hypothetical protein [Caldilineaceae bacterium]